MCFVASVSEVAESPGCGRRWYLAPQQTLRMSDSCSVPLPPAPETPEYPPLSRNTLLAYLALHGTSSEPGQSPSVTLLTFLEHGTPYRWTHPPAPFSLLPPCRLPHYPCPSSASFSLSIRGRRSCPNIPGARNLIQLHNTWVLETTKHSPGWRLVPSTPASVVSPQPSCAFPHQKGSPHPGAGACHLLASSEGWAQKKQLEASSKPSGTQRALI